MIIKYLGHLLNSKGPDRIHSPFVFDIYYYSMLGNALPYGILEIESINKLSKWKKAQRLPLKIIPILINKLKPKSILCLGINADYYAKYCDISTKGLKIFFSNLNKETLSLSQGKIVKVNTNEQANAEFLIIDSPKDTNKIELKSTTCLIIPHLYKKNNTTIWLEFKQNKRFHVFLDCFFVGVAIHRPKQVKEYFKLRF